MKKNIFKNKGFMMVEIVIATSIIAILIISMMSVVQRGISISRQSLHTIQAAYLLEEGAEAVRILRDNAWTNISELSTSLTYYLKIYKSWTLKPAAENNPWLSITYGNGLFVAISDSGTHQVMTSPDGINWTAQTTPSNTWNSITYGNGLFVAVSRTGTNKVMTSPDGINWTARSSGLETNYWRDVEYGNNVFVAVGLGTNSTFNNKIISSSDGITWTTRTLPSSALLYSVVYGEGMFVAVGYSSNLSSVIFTSLNGITWTKRNTSNIGYLNSIAYGNGLFVAVSDGILGGLSGSVFSPDGINWTVNQNSVGAYPLSVSFGNGNFLLVGMSAGSVSFLKSSSDGINWSDETIYTSNFWASIAYGGGLFVGVSMNGVNRVMISSGDTWALVTTPNTNDRFTRTVTLSNVKRDDNTEDIAQSGTDDPGTRLVRVNVSWVEGGRSVSKELYFYISNIFL
jgi:type II secretory pathway pseudopilin PulG